MPVFYRTVTIEVPKRLRLSWKKIIRERKSYPHKKFIVLALMQSDGEMLGYITKSNYGKEDSEYWSLYEGNQEYAHSLGPVFKQLAAAKRKLLSYYAGLMTMVMTK